MILEIKFAKPLCDQETMALLFSKVFSNRKLIDSEIPFFPFF